MPSLASQKRCRAAVEKVKATASWLMAPLGTLLMQAECKLGDSSGGKVDVSSTWRAVVRVTDGGAQTEVIAMSSNGTQSCISADAEVSLTYALGSLPFESPQCNDLRDIPPPICGVSPVQTLLTHAQH